MSDAVLLAVLSILSGVLTNIVFATYRDRREVARKKNETQIDIEKQRQEMLIEDERRKSQAQAAREAAEDAALKTVVQLGLQDLQHVRAKEAAQAERERVLLQQITLANERIDEQDRRIGRMETNIRDLTQKNTTQEAIIQTQAQEIKHLKDQIHVLQQEKGEMSRQIEDYRQRVANLQSALDKFDGLTGHS